MLKNYYRVLGVDEQASQAEIKAAYKRLVLLYHPDRNPSPDATSKFIEVKEAYDVLGDPDRKASYDHIRTNQAQYEQYYSQRATYNQPGYTNHTAQSARKHRSTGNPYWFVPMSIALVMCMARMFGTTYNADVPTATQVFIQEHGRQILLSDSVRAAYDNAFKDTAGYPGPVMAHPTDTTLQYQ